MKTEDEEEDNFRTKTEDNTEELKVWVRRIKVQIKRRNLLRNQGTAKIKFEILKIIIFLILIIIILMK